MVTLYERVLAHVPTQHLHQSYDAVLQEEFSSVDAAVDNVVAVFAKLEEIRDAVAQLEKVHESTGGHGASLMATMANVMMLQRELNKESDKLATGMTMTKLERKRKRVEEEVEQVSKVASPRVPTNGVDVSREVSNNGETKPSNVGKSCSSVENFVKGNKAGAQVARSNKRNSSGLARYDETQKSEIASGSTLESSSVSESESEDDDSGEGDAEAALKALMAKDVGNSAASNTVGKAMDMVTGSFSSTTNESATFMKTILEDVNKLPRLDRAFVIPDILFALKESVENDIDATQSSEVASSLNILVGWWAGEYEAQVGHLKLYREYITAVKLYLDRLPTSTHKAYLRRLIDALTSAVKKLGGLSKASVAVNRPIEQSTLLLSSIVGSVDSSSFARRQVHLLRALVAFKKETVSSDINDSRGKRISKPMTSVLRWVCQDPREPYPLHIYRMLLRAAQQVTGRISGAAERNSVVRLLDRMSEVLEDPSSHKTRKFLDDIRHRAVEVLQKLKRRHGRFVSEREVSTLASAVQELVDYTTYGWDPRQDLTTRKCVKELKSIITKSTHLKQTSRDLLAMIAKWKVDDPPATVKTPRTSA